MSRVRRLLAPGESGSAVYDRRMALAESVALYRRYAVRRMALRAGLLALAVAFFTGCQAGRGNAPRPETPVREADAARPAGVPADAVVVTASARYAAAEAGALLRMSCAGGLLTVVATRLELYAELPCERALPQEQVQPFLGVPIEVRISAGSGENKLRIASADAGLVEFSPGAIWVSERASLGDQGVGVAATRTRE